MTRALRTALALTVVAAVGWPAGRARAAPSAADREARHDFDEGETLYRAGHYAEALAKYQAGYAAVPLPGFLVNIAQCQRRLGDLKTARATYHEFVVVAPDSRLVPEVQALIKELDGLIADLAAGGSSGAVAKAEADDDEVHATDPAAPPPALAPTAPPVVAASLVAAPAANDADAPPPRRSHARWWIWGGIAVAAVAGGVATAVALSSPGTNTVRAGSLGTLSR
ncbi:MAG TPA: hypothetical protein VKZ18_04190 [Polyangia bacterium]|nr:hypothetical protein [Polyangia bacterium]